MRCEECGEDRWLTYRSRALGKRSVCAPCIRANHPETVDMSVIGSIPAPGNPIWDIPDRALLEPGPRRCSPWQ